ncbi:MAG: RdgB/HAM1 family non-canonical purine NTP pyrophosphatase [Thermoanaerobaculia bacterium]
MPASSSPLTETLVFVTSNAGKAREASELLGCAVEIRALELNEVQSLSFDEVVRAKARDAASRLGRAVLVEDSGLSIVAWNGFPGPLTKWVTQSVGEAGLARMLHPFPDRSATAVSALAIAWPDEEHVEPLVVMGRVEGTIAREPRGEQGFGWDVVFVPLGQERTFAEMSPREKNSRSHRSAAFELLAEARARARERS